MNQESSQHPNDVDASRSADCSAASNGPLMVAFEIPENFDDGFKLMVVWSSAYKRFGLGLSPHERKAAKQWFDSWYDSQQVGR